MDDINAASEPPAGPAPTITQSVINCGLFTPPLEGTAVDGLSAICR